MLDANLKPEAICIKDNYEEVITDMFSNFDSITLDYKVTPESFNEIKQTELRITKKIDIERKYFGIDEEEETDKDKAVELDKVHSMTKHIVSLKEEKDEAQKRKEKQAKDREKQDFGDAKDPLKYVLDERIIDKQKEVTMLEMQKEVSQLIESKNFSQNDNTIVNNNN